MEKIALLLLILLLGLPSLKAQKLKKGTLIDIEGNIYQTILIGKYKWMAENLKTTIYNNGNKIPLVTQNNEWIGLTSGAYCWYNNDETNAEKYGALYNWYAVSTGNLCPDGWRIPSDNEWKYLEGFADSLFRIGNPVWDGTGERGFNAGHTLKATSNWGTSGNGNDTFGFSAIPGGERISNGRFLLLNQSGFWWSRTETNASRAKYRCMIFCIDNIYRNNHPKFVGFSVRCLKDN